MYSGPVKWRFTAYGIFSNTSTPNLIVGIYYGGAAGANPLLTSSASFATTTGASSWCTRKIEAYTEIRTVRLDRHRLVPGLVLQPDFRLLREHRRAPMSRTAQAVTVNTTANSILTRGRHVGR